MTATTPTHVDSSIPEIWAKRVLMESLRGGFWGRFVGSAIVQQTELTNASGDTIHIQVTAPLSGSGVSGDQTTLHGNEENLTTSEIKVIPLLYRHGVLSWRRANKKSMLDLRNEAKRRLAEWGGEKMDDVRFANFLASGTFNGETYVPNTRSVGGGTGVPGDISTSDDLTVASIQEAALTMYNNNAQPLRTDDGNDVFGLVVSPNALHALKRESEYRDWVKDAEVRGKDNPFFKGAVCMIDGVVIYRHPNVVVASDGATSNPVARNIMFGAEAFVEGLDEGATWKEEEFDYGEQFGVAYSFAFQPRRALAKNSLILLSASDTV